MTDQEMGHLIRALKQAFINEPSGHDWHHLVRVRRNALMIADGEHITDTTIIELAALLHDVPDEKLVSSKREAEEKLKGYVSLLSLSDYEREKLNEIIFSISYKGGHEESLTSIEAMIVRDADRLDAIGAIGIARTFAYGGSRGQPIYDPDVGVRTDMTLDEYRNGKSTSIHHFHEKLLKLKDLMCTETGKNLAEERHTYMLGFLKQFDKEWNGHE
ncbi:HD domain-containing protein [Rossellomorea aquimaris]|uniref:HD domain-containing protein n=1 Tax=Rossellomorea aquimaris TaxID=189382 RepID=UPI001CD4C5AF|nr:HD domain-containing protein [Rossellomorea aquimaris]MCA1054557.1 HD domain-containing protein [Rossellomorea aquimaris]